MGPFHKLQSFFSASEVDVNNNSDNKMGFKGKNKRHFSSEIDFFSQGDGIKTKSYMWSSLKVTKRSKGKYCNLYLILSTIIIHFL